MAEGDPVKPAAGSLEQQFLDMVAASGGASTGQYLSGYGYPARTVINVDPTVAVNDADYKKIPALGGIKRSYTGDKLVDQYQTIRRNQYDLNPNTDANTILLGLAKNPVALKEVNNLLASRGFYGGSKPSRLGYDSVDRSAMAEFLNFANSQGVTFEVAKRIAETIPAVQGGTKAPSVRLTSKDDLNVVFRKTAQDLLGYELPDDVAQRFSKAYNQLEISEGQQAAAGGVYQAAAAPGTVAEQQIRQQFAPEAQSFAAGNYAEIMDRRIKELGA